MKNLQIQNLKYLLRGFNLRQPEEVWYQNSFQEYTGFTQH
jgi:hypothetical protein